MTRGAARSATRLVVVPVLVLAALAGCASRPGSVLVGEVATRLSGQASVDGALVHVRELDRIAQQHGGNRATLSPGYEASVDYVADVLRGAGYDVSTPTYEFSGELSDDSGRKAKGQQRNVIAQTRTGDPDRVVMLGAHLDSVPEGPGINDNGSGVAMLLELAKQLAAAGPTTNAVRFAFWGSEEQDMVGSTRYVQALSDPERKRILLYVNADMMASPNPGYFVQGGKGLDDDHAGPPGSAEVARVLIDQFHEQGVTAQTLTFQGDSDFAPFITAGVPTGGLLAGDEQEKTGRQAELWGGQEGEVFDHCYHQACDNADNINKVAFERFLRAAGGTLGYFAMFPGRIQE